MFRRSIILAALILPSAALAQQHWVGTWAAAPVSVGNNGNFPAVDSTLRQVVHVSIGGSTLRIRLSNEFGKQPLRVSGASIAVFTSGSAIDPATSTPVTFFGTPDVVIPPGAAVLSDRVAFKLAPLSDLAIDLFLPSQPMQQLTLHSEALQTNFSAPGRHLGAPALDSPTELNHWYFLDGVEVEAAPGAAAIVAFGDSITDGHGSTANTNSRYPDFLARQLQSNPKTRDIGVLNEGISGNRLLRDRGGLGALVRFDRDVLSQSGVRYLIILEGINDIGQRDKPAFPGDTVTQRDLTFILQQMIERAHAHGIKVYGATLTPFKSEQGSMDLQQQENDWIRTCGLFDAVIDFNHITADPADPLKLLKAYDSDNLHPGDAGYKAMGNGIDLSLFTK